MGFDGKCVQVDHIFGDFTFDWVKIYTSFFKPILLHSNANSRMFWDSSENHSVTMNTTLRTTFCLHRLQVTRKVPSITITLSKVPLDAALPG